MTVRVITEGATPKVETVGYDDVPLDVVRQFAEDGDPEAAAWLDSQGLTAATFEFDPDQARGEDGRWTSEGGGGGEGTYLTRHGADDVVASDLVSSRAVGIADQHTHDDYENAPEYGMYADVPRDETTGEPEPPPEMWEPGSTHALSESASQWGASFTTAREMQAAADALLGYETEGVFDAERAAYAQEMLTAMAGQHESTGAATAYGFVVDEPVYIGARYFGPDGLMRGGR